MMQKLRVLFLRNWISKGSSALVFAISLSMLMTGITLAQDGSTLPTNLVPPPWYFYAVAVVVVGVSVWVAYLVNNALLKSPDWSFAKALSEKAVVPLFDKEGKPIQNATNATHRNEYQTSTTRLIAFVGAIVILIFFSGFGLLAMHKFAYGGLNWEHLEPVFYYLLSGMILFVPYAINRLSGLVGGWLGKPKA
ncbi:hypothetical protein [Fulvimarina sp. MAC3]|uniref:hypothetical protein n=1 Tax=Fulvimarina sp. MAC3 TaxID=3148887 RepID=UPI0031FBF2CB